MAAPNVVNVSTITAKSVTKALTTNAQSIVSNPASSGKVFKINSLYVSNIDGDTPQDVTINYYPEDDAGGTGVAIVKTISIPADAAVIVIDKNSSIYLEEDRSIGGLAGGNSDIEVLCSYEEIS
jgi:hypothetical protein